MPKIEMIEGADDGAIAAWFAQRLRAALAMSPEIAVTVPGGSTPFPIFDRLAKEALPWPRISVWPGDDRIVEEDHPASNVGKIRARTIRRQCAASRPIRFPPKRRSTASA